MNVILSSLASLLDSVIDMEVAKTDTSFLVFQDICWHSGLSNCNCNI